MIGLTSGKIAVDPMLDPELSAGGIIIPDIAKDKCDQGIVRYVADDVTEIAVGDHVLFSAYTGTTVRLEGEGLLIILHQDFVTCKVEDLDTEVPGLYFKGKTDWNDVRNKLRDIISDMVAPGTNNGFTESDLGTIIDMCQPEYWPATREMATRFIADAVGEHKKVKARMLNKKEAVGRGE